MPRVEKMFEKHENGGWTDWLHPVKRRGVIPYILVCCDCGLAHSMEFAIVDKDGERVDHMEFEKQTGMTLNFRAKRNNLSTAHNRRHMKGKTT